MSAWDDIQKAIGSGNAARTAYLVAALDEPGRRAVAKELPGQPKALRAASEFGFLEQKVQEPLLLTGAGTISGAAAAASWLCRRELRPWWSVDRFATLCAMLCRVTAIRPDEWRVDVAHRVAARLRVSEESWVLWHIAAAFAKSANAAPPVSDGFVVGWTADGGRPQELADDPFLDALVPRLFEVDGVGAALADDANRGQWDDSHKGTWADALADLAHTGRLERASLLDGCVSRFLRGGTARNLRWFVRLHEALEPTEDEAAARVRDYVRLLPTAPSTVADLALRQVRRVDDLGRLDPALFEEAAGAVLFRPEKKLVRTALTWLDRTARARGRVDVTLRAVTAVFASDALDLRERAVKIAARHAARAGEAAHDEIRNAAADLPADLRATVATAFGELEAPAEPPPPVGPPPFVPRELRVPIGSLTELAEEFVVLIRSAEEWGPIERFVAALTKFAYKDPDATREALRRHVPPWVLDDGGVAYMRSYVERSWAPFAVRSLFHPKTTHGLTSVVGSFLKSRSRKSGTEFVPQMERFLYWRLREVASDVGRVPVLLATPTGGAGHVDPDVLVGRLEQMEKARSKPGRADLMQAMLRVPREIDTATVARAKGLKSTAGRVVASWLADGGLADPAVECEVLDRSIGTIRGKKVLLPTRVLATVDVPGDSDIAHLCAFPEEGWRDFGTQNFYTFSGFWPSVLPSHREVTAAHLVPYLAGTDDHDWGQGAIMLGLAEADGPAGAATGTLLAYALTNRHQQERTDAVEAFLALSGRGQLPAEETGAALGKLAAHGRVALPRAVKALTTAADAGAHADVWATLAAALPHVLPGPDERAPGGVPALLTLATRMAEATGAQGTIPAVADVAARGGSSRLVAESARLHRTLAT